MAAGASAGAASPSGMASPGWPIQASVAPTFTTSPSLASSDKITPEPGLGISVSTLSVFTSRMGSYSSTLSPAAFSHLVTVASVTASPNKGMISLVGMAAPSFSLVACASRDQ